MGSRLQACWRANPLDTDDWLGSAIRRRLGGYGTFLLADEETSGAGFCWTSVDDLRRAVRGSEGIPKCFFVSHEDRECAARFIAFEPWIV